LTPTRFIYPSPDFDYYWKQGHGKKMIAKLDKIPTQTEIEKHIPKLFEFDSLADEVIRDIYLKNGFKEADNLIQNALKNGIDSVPDAPICLQNLFSEMEKTPDWLDPQILKNGVDFCQRGAAFGLMVLRNYSLMGGYESAAINKPLIFTGALKKGSVKRITDTTEFWINITGNNALNRFEAGFESCLKTRLMHAYARVSILNDPNWETESWGIPLNAWDMIATNLGFSLVYLNGLNLLGYKASSKDIEGLFHFWKYVGHLIGIPPSYLPNTEKEAIEALYSWTITQPPGDEDTKTLAIALMNEPFKANFPKYYWQKKFVVQSHLAYNHFFLGKRSCENMKLPKSKLWFLPYIAKYLNHLNEFIAYKNEFFMKRRIKKGRNQQEKIKAIFFFR
jgi:hypothetical protein